MRRLRWPLIALSMFLAGSVASAWAGHALAPASYTGCLKTSTGVVSKVKRGNAPLSGCESGETQIHLSGGDITSVLPEPGLGLVGGGSSGAVTLGIEQALLDQIRCGVYPKPDLDLSGCDLSGAFLQNAKLDQSNLSFANLDGAYLEGAKLNYTMLSGASMDGAYLRNAWLRHAVLTSANLDGADLRYANVSYADFSGANLANADLQYTQWYATICPDGTNSDFNGGTCEGHLTP